MTLLIEKERGLLELSEQLSIKQNDLKQLFSELEQKGIIVHIDTNGLVNLPGSISILSSEVIQSVLATENKAKVDLDCRLVIDSTNQQLLNSLPNLQKLCVCSAEWQAKGRGRLQRSWISPMGQNLLFSMARHWQKGEPLVEAGVLEILSLMAGVAVATTLKELDFSVVKLKWPNDIVVKNSNHQLEKIAGILVESKTDSRQGTWVVGIGLNVNDVSSWHNQVDQNITSLVQLTSADYSREVLIAGIIENWLSLEQLLVTQGVSEIIQKWREFDVLFGETLHIQPTTGESYTAIARGINEQGMLKLEATHQDGLEIILVHSGDVKVRIKHATVS